jgi:hypothetical protein
VNLIRSERQGQFYFYFIAGQRFDHTGSYNLAYAMFLVFDLAATILIWSIQKSRGDRIPTK